MSGGHFLPKLITVVWLRTAGRRESNRYGWLVRTKLLSETKFMEREKGMRLNSEKILMTNSIEIEPVTFTASTTLQQWKVPSGVRKVHVDCVASQGMNGGKGGRVQCDLKVSPGQILYIMVGNVPTVLHESAYNASDVRIGGNGYVNRVVVVGGGGNSSSRNVIGGAGGGLTGGMGGMVLGVIPQVKAARKPLAVRVENKPKFLSGMDMTEIPVLWG